MIRQSASLPVSATDTAPARPRITDCSRPGPITAWNFGERRVVTAVTVTTGRLAWAEPS